MGSRRNKGARFALSSAEKAYRNGQNDVGDYFMKVGTVLLDAGLGFVPGVGWAKDVYEFASGRNAITGEELTTFERTMAAVGILTAGIGSKIAVAGKVAVLAGIVKSGAKNADEAADVAKLAEAGGEIVEAAKKVPGLADDAADVGKFAEASAKYGRSPESIQESLKSGQGMYGNAEKIGRNALNDAQAKNLKRFEDKLPAGSDPVTVHKEGTNTIFKGEVPGRVPGSKAVYEKVVDTAGDTKVYTKTTYTPDGRIVHIKDKIDGSVIVPE